MKEKRKKEKFNLGQSTAVIHIYIFNHSMILIFFFIGFFFLDSYVRGLVLTALADNMAKLEGDGKLSEKQHPKDLFFRVDHQTFRKLPKTKGIIFGVYVSLSTTSFCRSSSLSSLTNGLHSFVGTRS